MPLSSRYAASDCSTVPPTRTLTHGLVHFCPRSTHVWKTCVTQASRAPAGSAFGVAHEADVDRCDAFGAGFTE